MASITRSLFAAIAICASFSASAVTWGQQTTITGYYVYASGGAYLKTANNQNPDSCASGTTYLYLDPSVPRFKEIWATIMTAQATGSTVSVRYVGCGGGNYPQIDAVAVPASW